MIFLRVLPKIFLWPHYSGAPGARGPRFIEPPEPPVTTPLPARTAAGPGFESWFVHLPRDVIWLISWEDMAQYGLFVLKVSLNINQPNPLWGSMSVRWLGSSRQTISDYTLRQWFPNTQTIPIHDIAYIYRLVKISFTFNFDASFSFLMMWNLQSLLYNNTYEWKNVTF